MAGSFRNTRSFVDKVYRSGPHPKKNLSIGLLSDGFVFSLLDAEEYKYIALEEYKQEDNSEANMYLGFLRTLFDENPLLTQPFDKVNILYYSPRLVLVPNELYNKEDEKALFGFCASSSNHDQIRSDRLNITKAHGIYSIPVELITLCQEMFPRCRLLHYGSALIESTLAAQKLEKWGADMVLHIQSGHFELLLLRNNKLTYYNTFTIQCLDDMLYYIFYVLEQYGLQAGQLKTVILGELAMDEKAFALLASFFRETAFPEKNDMYQYSPEFDRIPYHFYFNLLNLNSCG